MSKCHKAHFANLLPLPIICGVGKGSISLAAQSPFFSVTELQPYTTCLRMVSQANEQIQEKLRRHHLRVSERRPLATSS